MTTELTFGRTFRNLDKLAIDLSDWNKENNDVYSHFNATAEKPNADATVTVYFKSPISQVQIEDLTQFASTFSEVSVHANLVSHLRHNVKKFADKIKFDFAADNIEMGITQAGKTREVADFMRNISYYVDTYSLYTAVEEIDILISQGIDPDLAPFITEQRLTQFKQKIMDFLT